MSLPTLLLQKHIYYHSNAVVPLYVVQDKRHCAILTLC